jgi:molecular chaperone GrpE
MSRRKRKSRDHGDHSESADDAHGLVPADASASGVGDSGGEPPDPDPDPRESSESGAPGAPGTMLAELERLGSEASEMRDLAQRTRAECENYKKRMERERAELVRLAGFEVVKEILPVLDNLERAIRASESSPEEQFRAGIEIIQRQFKEILTRMGLSEVESEGKPFDPHLHEAVSRVETTKHPEGTVVEVFQRGYTFKDRLIRPAMVAVAQLPSGGGRNDGGPSTENEGEVVRRSD